MGDRYKITRDGNTTRPFVVRDRDGRWIKSFAHIKEAEEIANILNAEALGWKDEAAIEEGAQEYHVLVNVKAVTSHYVMATSAEEAKEKALKEFEGMSTSDRADYMGLYDLDDLNYEVGTIATTHPEYTVITEENDHE